MKAYSLDLRQRVLSAALRGDRTIPEVAGLFGVELICRVFSGWNLLM